MTQKVHVEVSYGYDRVYPDDVNLSDVVDDITYMERTYGHVSAQVNVSLVEPEPEKVALPTAYGSVVSGADSFGTRYKYVLVGPSGRWEYVAANGTHYTDRELLGSRKNLRVEYDAGKAGK